METTDGEDVELKDIPENVCSDIDELIEEDYDVSWGDWLDDCTKCVKRVTTDCGNDTTLLTCYEERRDK